MYNNKTPHLDYFGTPVSIGDLVLGAQGKRNNFQDTIYSFSVVIGLTKGMVRLHKLGENKDVLSFTRGKILEEVSHREHRRGGTLLASNLINLNKPTGITEVEFTTERLKRSALNSLTPKRTLFSLTFP